MSAVAGTPPNAAAGPHADGFVPFPPQRAARYRAAGYWAGLRVDALLRRSASRWPDRLAVSGPDRAYSYTDLDRLVDRTAGGFAALGIAPGDRVLLQLPNSARFAVALFGLLRAGAVPVLCLPGHRSAELSHFADRAEATGLVLAGADPPDTAERLLRTRPRLRHVVVADAAGPFPSLSTLPAGDPPVLVGDTGSPALLLASGGTTGLPKLIPRTHDDYVYTATASAALCRLTAADVYLAALPAAHNFPLACPGLLGAVAVGAATVFTADPSPESAFATIARHNVTVTALVPALARLWAQACDWEPLPPTSLRLLQVGGARLAPEDAHRIRTALGPVLQQVFGMAEGLLNFTRLDDPAEVVDHTQGRPLCPADEVRIVDDTGVEVADGTDGELLVRGPYTLNGYLNDPAANHRSFTPDGFFRSGDRVRRRPDGNVEVTGRIKDVIVRAGETVAAGDVEAHLLTHPAIGAAAVVGLPDPQLGEKICAAVTFTAAPVSLAELNRHLDRRGAATHTRVDTLVAMPALPTTAVGKVDKTALRHRLAD